MRAFLAIPVLPPALDAFQALRERFVADVAAVRWAPVDSPHITVHFFGAISADDADRALDALRPVIGAYPPMTLRLRGLGSFPSLSHPRVLWCGVDDDGGALSACVRACAEALQTAGFPVEDRPYRPHCTLGRPRQPWPTHALERWQRLATEEPRTPVFTADRAILYESLTGPGGVRHVPREVLPLGTALQRQNATT